MALKICRLLPSLLLTATLLLAAQVALSQPPPGDVVLLSHDPVPWRAVHMRDEHGPFYWKTDWMEGYAPAEHKVGEGYYKVDVYGEACARWSWLDDVPAVELDFEDVACAGGFWLEGGVYWFGVGEAGATPTPTPSHTIADWIPRFVNYYAETGRGYDDAGAYGVETYTPADSDLVVHVHHLTGAENNGNHHVFFSVVGLSGQPLAGQTIRYYPAACGGDWQTVVTGADGLADVPLEKSDTLVAALDDATVDGLHARHPDEEAGNTWGHHSFYVVFQRVGAAPVPTSTPTPTATPGPGEPTPVLCPNAQSITVYGGGGGLYTPRCGCQKYGTGDGEWWALVCEVTDSRFQEFLDAWQELVEDAASTY